MSSFIIISAVLVVWIVLGSIPLVICIRSSQFTKDVNDYEAYMKKNVVPFPKFDKEPASSEKAEIPQEVS